MEGRLVLVVDLSEEFGHLVEHELELFRAGLQLSEVIFVLAVAELGQIEIIAIFEVSSI